MVSPQSIDFSSGLQNMIRSISERSAPPQLHSSASCKPSPHLNVSDCYKLLEKPDGDRREDAVMRQALELYCSLLTPPTTPSPGAGDRQGHQDAADTETNEQYCSILSSYTGLSSASPRSSNFQKSPGNDYLLSYPKDLSYNMSTPSLSVSERSSTDLDESNETDAYHSGTSRVFRPNSPDDQSLYPIGAASGSSASEDDVDDDDPFARQPGVSRAPGFQYMPTDSTMTSKSTITNFPLAQDSVLYEINSRTRNTGGLVDSKQAHFVFPKPAQKVQVYHGPAHLSVAPQTARTSYTSSKPHVPPRRRMSSLGGSLCEGLMIPTEPLPSFISPGSTIPPPVVLEDSTHSAQRATGDAKLKTQRTRAMSVINFGFHRANTSAPPPLPVLPPVISDPIPLGQPLPVTNKKVKVEPLKLQQRSRSHTMSNSAKIYPNDLYMSSRPVPPTMLEEEEVVSKANRRLTQKDAKSLWKALKKSTIGSGSSKPTSIDSMGPPTESLDKTLGRATAGGGMRYPSAARPAI